MRELIFQVEFKSDIVLPATSNTEGNIQNLDFIAGSNFLGMVAKNYNNFSNSFDVFHSGKVRFGDATVLKDNKITYKMPLSYFYEKLDDKKIFNHHLIKDFKQFNQLKQKRDGYITKDLDEVYIDYNYSQKSAYDKSKRTSLEGSMFGYTAIKNGLKWQFIVKIDNSIDNKDIKLLKKTLLDSKRLGKSKSAQYGRVEITPKENPKVEEIEDKSKKDTTILYFNSRVALIDNNGYPTLDLSYICDGLEVDYSKTQIKTQTFTPYNGARETKDYERVVISKGSVVAIKDIKQEQLDSIKSGIGAYLSEGFGDILINPTFLSEYSFEFGSKASALSKDGAKAPIPTTHLAKFLKQKEKDREDKLNNLNDVDIFILKYKKSLFNNIKPSQWGKIRSICTSGNDNFIEEIRNYISNGTKKWEQNQIDILLNDNNSLEFIKLISIQMPKQGAKNEK